MLVGARLLNGAVVSVACKPTDTIEQFEQKLARSAAAQGQPLAPWQPGHPSWGVLFGGSTFRRYGRTLKDYGLTGPMPKVPGRPVGSLSLPQVRLVSNFTSEATLRKPRHPLLQPAPPINPARPVDSGKWETAVALARMGGDSSQQMLPWLPDHPLPTKQYPTREWKPEPYQGHYLTQRGVYVQANVNGP